MGQEGGSQGGKVQLWSSHRPLPPRCSMVTFRGPGDPVSRVFLETTGGGLIPPSIPSIPCDPGFRESSADIAPPRLRGQGQGLLWAGTASPERAMAGALVSWAGLEGQAAGDQGCLGWWTSPGGPTLALQGRACVSLCCPKAQHGPELQRVTSTGQCTPNFMWADTNDRGASVCPGDWPRGSLRFHCFSAKLLQMKPGGQTLKLSICGQWGMAGLPLSVAAARHLPVPWHLGSHLSPCPVSLCPICAL